MISLQIIAKATTAQLKLVDSNLDTAEKIPVFQYESGWIKLLVKWLYVPNIYAGGLVLFDLTINSLSTL